MKYEVHFAVVDDVKNMDPKKDVVGFQYPAYLCDVNAIFPGFTLN